MGNYIDESNEFCNGATVWHLFTQDYVILLLILADFLLCRLSSLKQREDNYEHLHFLRCSSRMGWSERGPSNSRFLYVLF